MNIESKNFEELLGSVSLLLPRMTRSIEALLFIFSNSPGPISVPDILKKLASRKIRVNKVTIYRKLVLLQQIGIIEEVLLSGEKKYYELAREHHHHLVCLSCEQVTDWIPNESILKREACRLEKEGFQVQYHSLELFGLCKQCA
ncbi:MAG: transcriptional repressor [Candidatus Moranbacteria bacterium]|jgi:Fe2+ or Zn2+ uptake regulation protein|nr:transcriptional repressor [Candidatus Moranbacteria bacterium]MDQ5961574.1 Fur family transcriptional regulator, ferric uptake regulator [Patescibacteria group bacterium]